MQNGIITMQKILPWGKHPIGVFLKILEWFKIAFCFKKEVLFLVGEKKEYDYEGKHTHKF